MSVRVATTANITLDNTTTTVDGVTLANGDLILVKNQTSGTENGVYVVSTSGAWSRSSILPSGISAYKKMFYVTNGTVNQNLNFNCLVSPAVVGTNSLVFMPYNNAILNNFSATAAPTTSDDNSKGYSVGSMWINTTGSTIYTCTNNSTGAAVWSQGGGGGSTDYMVGNLTATVLTNVSVGDHAPFNQAYQSSNGGSSTTNITLDTTSAYSNATNTASVGRITLKANLTYTIIGIVKSLAGIDYYGYAWYNSDTNTRIGTRGEGFASTSQAASTSSNPSYCTFTPSVDTRIELRLTESLTGSIVNWYAGSTGYGETMFSISVATSASSSSGGSPTEVSFVSLSAGSAGDIVQLDSTGKVKSLIETTPGTSGTIASTTGPNAISAVSAPLTNKFFISCVVGGQRVIAFYGGTANGGIVVQASTLDGSTWGSPVNPTGPVANPITNTWNPIDIFEIDSTRFGLLCTNSGGTSGTIVIGSLAGIAITFYNTLGYFIPVTANNFRALMWTSTKILISYTNVTIFSSAGGSGYFLTLTVGNDNTITSDANTVTTTFGGTLYGLTITKLSTTRVVYNWFISSIWQGQITISGNTLTVTNTFNTGLSPTDYYYGYVVPIDGTNSMVLSSSNTGNSTINYNLTLCGSAGAVPTSRATGSFTVGGSYTVQYVYAIYLTSTNVQILYRSNQDTKLRGCTLDISAYPTVTKVSGSDVVITNNPFGYPSAGLNAQSDKSIAFYYGGKTSVNYIDSVLSYNPVLIIQTWGNTSFISKSKAMGILKTSVLANGTVTVIIIGGTASIYSGLTPGSTYYIGDNARPTTTVNSYPFGIALSTTSLQYNPIFPVPTITSTVVYNTGSLISDGVGTSIYTDYTGANDGIIRIFNNNTLTYMMDPNKLSIKTLQLYPPLSTASAPAVLSGISSLYPDTTLNAMRLSVSGNAFATIPVGPSSSTATALTRFTDTTGASLNTSSVTLSDTADLAGVKTLALSGSTSGTLTLKPAATTTSYTATMPSAQGVANSILQNDGAGILSWSLLAGMKGIRYITATGTYTPTAGTTRALVIVTGGGGAGGGAVSGVNNSVGSGGNTGGTYVGLFVIDDTKTGTVTIGPGGTGASGTSGGDGTATTFLFPSSGTPNATITGNGGNGGNTKGTGTSDNYFIPSDVAYASGTATAVNAVLLGGFPITGIIGGTGEMNNPDVGAGGLGGNTLWGGGGGSVSKNDVSSGSSGNAAQANTGSGGGGAIQTNNSGTSYAGGAGGSGRVIVLEY